MKTAVLITMAFAALVAGDVSVTDLPTCALTCAASAASTAGCGLSDIACFCSSAAYASSMYECVPQSCDAADQETTFTVAEELCAQAGVPDEALQSTAAPVATPDAATGSTVEATTTASATSMTETAAVMPTTTSAIPENGLYASPSADMTVTVTAPCSATSSSTATVATTGVVAYTGAASNVQVGVGMLALIGFAML